MNEATARRVQEFGCPTIAVNKTFELAPQACLLYAADGDFWRFTEGARAFRGLKVSCSVQDTHKMPPPHWVETLKMSGVSGFDPDPQCVRTGNNSGYQALHVAVQAGAKRVLLFGFDMRGAHWHGEHEAPLKNPTPNSFDSWIREFTTLARILKEMDVEVINCSVDSAMKCFPIVPMEQAFEASSHILSRRVA